MEDLLFYHRVAIETGTSKSAKLANSCFLFGSAGTTTDKIEASHVLQKQGIYATGGAEVVLTLDTLEELARRIGVEQTVQNARPHEPYLALSRAQLSF